MRPPLSLMTSRNEAAESGQNCSASSSDITRLRTRVSRRLSGLPTSSAVVRNVLPRGKERLMPPLRLMRTCPLRSISWSGRIKVRKTFLPVGLRTHTMCALLKLDFTDNFVFVKTYFWLILGLRGLRKFRQAQRLCSPAEFDCMRG